MNHFYKKQSGFTLIEMIIAMSLFVLVLVLATNVYFLINNSQRRVVAMQKVQDDVRYVFEAMAQEVRLDKINYSFYNTTGSPGLPVDLHPLASAANYMLATTNQQGDQVFFRRSSSVADQNDGLGTKVQYCQILLGATTTCEVDNDSLWEDVTPNGVEIVDLRFYITPSADPFTAITGQSCDAGNPNCTGTALSYRCDIAQGRCEYYSDGRNFQPKVRMVLQARATDSNIPELSRTVHMQTTISSRSIQSKALNTYSDLP